MHMIINIKSQIMGNTCLELNNIAYQKEIDIIVSPPPLTKGQFPQNPQSSPPVSKISDSNSGGNLSEDDFKELQLFKKSTGNESPRMIQNEDEQAENLRKVAYPGSKTKCIRNKNQKTKQSQVEESRLKKSPIYINENTQISESGEIKNSSIDINEETQISQSGGIRQSLSPSKQPILRNSPVYINEKTQIFQSGGIINSGRNALQRTKQSFKPDYPSLSSN